jgi:hypothetical protein
MASKRSGAVIGRLAWLFGHHRFSDMTIILATPREIPHVIRSDQDPVSWDCYEGTRCALQHFLLCTCLHPLVHVLFEFLYVVRNKMNQALSQPANTVGQTAAHVALAFAGAMQKARPSRNPDVTQPVTPEADNRQLCSQQHQKQSKAQGKRQQQGQQGDVEQVLLEEGAVTFPATR